MRSVNEEDRRRSTRSSAPFNTYWCIWRAKHSAPHQYQNPLPAISRPRLHGGTSVGSCEPVALATRNSFINEWSLCDHFYVGMDLLLSLCSTWWYHLLKVLPRSLPATAAALGLITCPMTGCTATVPAAEKPAPLPQLASRSVFQFGQASFVSLWTFSCV